MQSMNIVLESGEEIVSYLLPPKIHLEVEIDRPGGAVYYIYFDYGGHAKILDNQQPEYVCLLYFLIFILPNRSKADSTIVDSASFQLRAGDLLSTLILH